MEFSFDKTINEIYLIRKAIKRLYVLHAFNCLVQCEIKFDRLR